MGIIVADWESKRPFFFKDLEKFIVAFLIRFTAETITPLDSGSQCTLGNIGGTDIQFAVIRVMKEIRLRMKGAFFQ